VIDDGSPLLRPWSAVVRSSGSASTGVEKDGGEFIGEWWCDNAWLAHRTRTIVIGSRDHRDSNGLRYRERWLPTGSSHGGRGVGGVGGGRKWL